jgi:predicted DCC family thiol-disulfide oxidoreductase YuxK
MLLIQDGMARQRSDAVLSIAAQRPALYRWAIIGRIAPLFIRDRLYDFVARRRRRFPGATWCALPPASVDLKDRVLG